MSTSRKPFSHLKRWQKVTLVVVVSCMVLTLVGSSLVGLMNRGTGSTAVFSTSVGTFEVELDSGAAPQGTAAVETLIAQGFYTQKLCYGLTAEQQSVLYCGLTVSGPPEANLTLPVENVPSNETYRAGDVVLDRQSNNGLTVTGGLFIVYKDVKIPTQDTKGYTVVGRVTSGFELLENFATTNGTASLNGGTAITIEGVNVR
ncbi:peptidylprolyl isomerase [Micrococcales bacterium 31B]|nr:peptidylprolyl isomerase [Micrococcales bacterium 31B]